MPRRAAGSFWPWGHRLASGVAPRACGLSRLGATLHSRTPASDRDRDEIVEEVTAFAKRFAGGRLASAWAEVAHELLMNALYDAARDEDGRAFYAHDRTASISLLPEQRPRFFFGCDGLRLLLTVQDPFGALHRSHLFSGLARAQADKTMDRSGGGAGLGFMVIYQASTMIFVDVLPGVRTTVSALLELDVPQRELRRLPRSVHFFNESRSRKAR
jgi:hypothetical protein